MAKFALAAALCGCGDIGVVRLDVQFPDEDTELRTRALRVVVRQSPMSGDGCQALWSTQPTGLPETTSVVEYPNRNDILAAPVKLSMYPSLTYFIYAHPTADVSTSQAIAGGCIQSGTDPEATQELTVSLAKR